MILCRGSYSPFSSEVIKDTANARKEAARLLAIQKQMQHDKDIGSNVADSIQDLIANFKAVGPKLTQICIIPNTVRKPSNTFSSDNCPDELTFMCALLGQGYR